MMKRVAGIVAIGVLVCLAGCRRQDWRTLVLDVPDMHNKAAVDHVVQAIGRGPGVQPGSVTVDMKQRQIRFQYDSIQAADMNFVHLVAAAGFSANGIPADKQARAALPPALRP